MKTKWFALAAVAALMIVGCGKKEGDAPTEPAKKAEIPKQLIEKGQEAKLFPVKVGNQWTYAVEVSAPGQTQTFDIQFKITDVKVEGISTKFQMEVTTEKGKPQNQSWEINERGLFQITGGEQNTAYNPPMPAILFPWEDGKTFKYEGTGVMPMGGVGKMKFDAKYLAAQQVDTVNQAMNGYAIEQTTEFSNDKVKGQSVTTTYWTPNVGLTRFRQMIASGNAQIVQTLRLRNFTVQ